MWSKADALATQMREVLKIHPWVRIICLASMRKLRIVKTTLGESEIRAVNSDSGGADSTEVRDKLRLIKEGLGDMPSILCNKNLDIGRL